MRKYRTSIALFFAAGLLGSPPAAKAQMSMPGHAMEIRDQTPPAQLPVPRRMTGIGNSHLPITATPEAQMWFDQGLNLLHDFWDYESARAFQQAVRVDPQCAMCYWGLYKAESFFHGNSQGYAAPALAEAGRIQDRVSPRERLYIEAAAAYEAALEADTSGPDSSRDLALLRQIVKDYPGDLQARIFLAGRVTRDESLAMWRSILQDHPDDSAANHYYIHALEGTDHPEQALSSAEKLARLAPASGHMVHMPGHIFFRLGDYARAEQAFAASRQVDETYMREQRVDPDNDWNYVHNLMYEIANLMEEGRLREATELSAKLSGARGGLPSTMYIYSTRDSISRLDPRLPVALRTADWSRVAELAKAGTPPAGLPNLEFLARQLVVFAAGMQAVEKPDAATAAAQSAQFDAELKRMSGQLKTPPEMPAAGPHAPGPPKLLVMADALAGPLLSTLSVMSAELRASLAAAQGKAAEAKTLFATAEQLEKELGYREPPGYIRPVAETEGAAMLAIGDWTAARAAYQRALRERPRSGLALYGIALSSEKAGDSAAAARQYADFLDSWKNADPSLPQVAHARAWLAAHPPGGPIPK